MGGANGDPSIQWILAPSRVGGRCGWSIFFSGSGLRGLVVVSGVCGVSSGNRYFSDEFPGELDGVVVLVYVLPALGPLGRVVVFVGVLDVLLLAPLLLLLGLWLLY